MIITTQVYSELYQTTIMESFSKIVSNCKPLTIFAKCSNLDVWQGSEYVSVIQYLIIIANINNYLFYNKICCYRKILRRKGSKCVIGFTTYKSYTSQLNHKFFNVLYYDYSKFGPKITMCCLENIRIQFKK